MSKIQRLSQCLRGLFIVMIVVLPVLFVAFWWQAPAPIAFGGVHSVFQISFIPAPLPLIAPLTQTTRWLGAGISLLPLLINLFILYCLVSLFGQFQRGQLFVIDNIWHMKHIGYALIVGQLLKPFIDAALSATLTWHNPPGHRLLEMSITSANIGLLLTGLLVIVISWIMAEGFRLQQEHDYTI